MSDHPEDGQPVAYPDLSKPIGNIVQIAAVRGDGFNEQSIVFALSSIGRVFFYEVPRRGTGGASTWRWTEIPPIVSPWRIEDE